MLETFNPKKVVMLATSFVCLREAQLRVHEALFERGHPALLVAIALGQLTEQQEFDLHVCEHWLRKLAYCGGAPLARPGDDDDEWIAVDVDQVCDFVESYADVARRSGYERYADHLLGQNGADEVSLMEYRLAHEALGDDPSALATRIDIGFGLAKLEQAIEALKVLVRVTSIGATTIPAEAVNAIRMWDRGRWNEAHIPAPAGRPAGALSPLGERTVQTMVLLGDPDVAAETLLEAMVRRRDFDIDGEHLSFRPTGKKPQRPKIRSWRRQLGGWREIARQRLGDGS